MRIFYGVFSLFFFFSVIHKTNSEQKSDETFENQEIETPISYLEHQKLLFFLNSIRENNQELIERLQINGKESSLSTFIKKAWDRNIKFEFKSSFLPVYLSCHDEEKNIFHRRGGTVLEVIARNKRTDRMETFRWIAVFRNEKRTGYYLEHLKDLDVIPIEEKEKKTQQEDIIIDYVYTCTNSRKNQTTGRERYILDRKRENLISEEIEREWNDDGYELGPPGIPSAPSNPVTAAPIRRQPTVVQTTWAPESPPPPSPMEQSNTWQQQENNWRPDQENNQNERWGPPNWRERGPPPPDFEGWHHRPPWRRGPWWRRPPPPWGPPPPGPPPPPFGGWRGL